jgi:hypothetical protein
MLRRDTYSAMSQWAWPTQDEVREEVLLLLESEPNRPESQTRRYPFQQVREVAQEGEE